MTVEQYQARNAAITAEIEKQKGSADWHTGQASAYKQLAVQWRNAKGDCSKGTAKQKQACNKDATDKEQTALGHEASAKSHENSASNIRGSIIPSLQNEFNNNIKLMESAQASSKEVSAILAQQGKTQTSVQTQTMEEAKANYEATLLKANAEAVGIAKSAEADAKNKKTMGYVIAGVGVVVIAIVGYFLFQKFKKRK